MPEHLRGFYAFHSCLMEPWDGPAAVAFTDGRVIGATLDRNGLRPGRWMETKDGWVVLALGDRRARRAAARTSLRKGRLQPGKLFLVDLERGPDRRGRGDQARASRPRRPYGDWYRSRASCGSSDLPERQAARARASRCARASSRSATRRRTCACCSRRWRPRARSRSARWATTSRWPCSPTSAPPLFSYFKQLFAQVTNPPIDPIRECGRDERSGPASARRRNLLDEAPEHAHQLVIAAADPAQRRARDAARRRLVASSARTRSTITWPVDEGPRA